MQNRLIWKQGRESKTDSRYSEYSKALEKAENSAILDQQQ